MKLRDDQWAKIYRKLRDTADYGWGEVTIKFIENRKVILKGGRSEEIIGYDDGEEKVLEQALDSLCINRA